MCNRFFTKYTFSWPIWQIDFKFLNVCHFCILGRHKVLLYTAIDCFVCKQTKSIVTVSSFKTKRSSDLLVPLISNVWRFLISPIRLLMKKTACTQPMLMQACLIIALYQTQANASSVSINYCIPSMYNGFPYRFLQTCRLCVFICNQYE